MKTYDERVLSIMGKAKRQKTRRLAVKMMVSVLCLVLVVSGALMLPDWIEYRLSIQSPIVDGPTPTNPVYTGSPTTPALPQPTCPYDPQPDRSASIQLNKLMEVTYRGPVVLQCSYFTNEAVYHPGDTVSITVVVQNLAGKIHYVGDVTDQFGAAALVYDGAEGAYKIPQVERPYTDDATQREFAHLETAILAYQFIIPEDAPEGSYVLEVDLFGSRVRFDEEATKETKYITRLSDLPEEAQKLIAREDYGTDFFARAADSVPIYGEFGNVYVAYYHFWGSDYSTSETVNGLTFNYVGDNNYVEVFTPQGIYRLQEALDLGILTDAQLKQVHDNFTLVGTYLLDYRYGPYFQTDTAQYVITDWQRRLRYTCYVGNKRVGWKYYSGDEFSIFISVENIGPEFYFGRDCKDIFGPSLSMVKEDGRFCLESESAKLGGISPITTVWGSGLRIGGSYSFTIPEDFQKGSYSIIATIFGKEVRFDAAAEADSLNLPMVDEIPHNVLKMIWGDHYNLNEELMDRYGSMPVYGWFEDTYVYVDSSGEPDLAVTSEIVNGLAFTYPDGYPMTVYKEGKGTFTLTEAFALGYLRPYQLQQVYENYTYVQSIPFEPLQFSL